MAGISAFWQVSAKEEGRQTQTETDRQTDYIFEDCRSNIIDRIDYIYNQCNRISSCDKSERLRNQT